MVIAQKKSTHVEGKDMGDGWIEVLHSKFRCNSGTINGSRHVKKQSGGDSIHPKADVSKDEHLPTSWQIVIRNVLAEKGHGLHSIGVTPEDLIGLARDDQFRALYEEEKAKPVEGYDKLQSAFYQVWDHPCDDQFRALYEEEKGKPVEIGTSVGQTPPLRGRSELTIDRTKPGWDAQV